MSSDIAISVKNLTKTYRIFGHPGDRIKQALTFGKKRFHKEFTALKDVSFEIKKGETVGIIGRNGCGKSTLLQLICGILKPTSGSLTVKGRILGLLELGSGFNPEFTGCENVYFQGAIMNFSKSQMYERFEEIAAFADIGEFIDQPVRTYSSGMFVRLAFAVVVHMAPDVLVIDEALSVGDVAFQRKCFARINKLRENGCTIIFVSHETNTIVNLCDRALLLDHGALIMIGSPKLVVNNYLTGMFLDAANADFNPTWETNFFNPALIPQSTNIYPSNGATIMEPKVLTLEGELVNLLQRGKEYFYTYQVHFHKSCEGVRCGMLIRMPNGFELGGLASSPEGDGLSVLPGLIFQQKFRFRCNLLPGTYYVNAGVVDREGSYLHRVLDAAMFEVLPGNSDFVTGTVDFSSIDEHHSVNFVQ